MASHSPSGCGGDAAEAAVEEEDEDRELLLPGDFVGDNGGRNMMMMMGGRRMKGKERKEWCWVFWVQLLEVCRVYRTLFSTDAAGLPSWSFFFRLSARPRSWRGHYFVHTGRLVGLLSCRRQTLLIGRLY